MKNDDLNDPQEISMWRRKFLDNLTLFICVSVILMAEIWFAYGRRFEKDVVTYWLLIYPQIREWSTVFFSVLLVLAIWFLGKVRWYKRLAITIPAVLFALISIGVAFLSDIIIFRHVTSASGNGHVYHLMRWELSGSYGDLYECDAIGLFCQHVGDFSGYATDLAVDPDSQMVTVLTGDSVIFEYQHQEPKSSP